MSILKKLQSIQQKQELDQTTRLTDQHALADTPLDFRLQYIAAIAMLIALEREPCERERSAFRHLATSLGLEPGEAEEQFKERADMGEDDILVLFAALRKQDAAWNYLADLAWLHCIDSNADEKETAVFAKATEFLGLNPQSPEWSQALQLPPLMQALQAEDHLAFAALRYRAKWPTELEAVLAVTTAKMMPVLEKNAVDLTIRSNDSLTSSAADLIKDKKVTVGGFPGFWFASSIKAGMEKEVSARGVKPRNDIEIENWWLSAGKAFQWKDILCIFKHESIKPFHFKLKRDEFLKVEDIPSLNFKSEDLLKSVIELEELSKGNETPSFTLKKKYFTKLMMELCPIMSNDIINGKVDALNAPFDGVFIKALVSPNERVSFDTPLARIYKI